MINIEFYRDLISIVIEENKISRFYNYFQDYADIDIDNTNGMKLFFVKSNKSEIIIKDSYISIFYSEKNYNYIKRKILNYIQSDRKYPMDISFEQIGFDITPSATKDVVIECGSFIDDDE